MKSIFRFQGQFAGLLLTLLIMAGVPQSSAQQNSPQRTDARAPSDREGQANSNEAPPNEAKPNEAKPNPSGSEHKSMAGELAKETRESTGEDQEEYSNLKHASAIQWMARKTGLSVHQAHLVALFINFAVIVILLLWAVRKFVPPMLKARNESIQRSLEEARAASQDANRRLSDIENRLRQLDVEIGQMQANAEKEADAEEARIQRASEEEIRKVVLGAEQEIEAAAKQVRRELAAHTANLAISLASREIRIDANTDEMLVRSFASTLASSENQDRPDRRDSNNATSRDSNNDQHNERGKDGR